MELAKKVSKYLNEIESEGIDIDAIENFIKKYNLDKFECEEFVGDMISAIEFGTEEDGILNFKIVFSEEVLNIYNCMESHMGVEAINKDREEVKKFINEDLDLENPKFTEKEVTYINSILSKKLNQIDIKKVISDSYFFCITGTCENEF